ncbi:V-type ATP synthase subunit E [Ruminococcaceae bacterium OttesenSCG-928-O06]|nr:V-type ATP synthase subunit E [Ruminococcaceae bacterium OttesenSCG-928-O06]
MTGLDKILQEIRDEAAAEAQQALAKAKAEADEILAAAKTESDAKVAAIEAAATQDVADIERSQESAAALQRRQRTLAQKQTLLAETLDRALQALYALDEDAYFALLSRQAVKAAQPGEGILMLNEKDKKRLPAGFEKQVADALPAGASLKVSDATRPIDGGFVLKYGDVEENCSFEAIFNARTDEFSDMIREVLFA